MIKIKKEAFLFLSKMAERRTGDTIPLDQLHQYTAIVKHLSDVQYIDFKDIKNVLNCINDEVFTEYPELLSKIAGLKECIKIM